MKVSLTIFMFIMHSKTIRTLTLNNHQTQSSVTNDQLTLTKTCKESDQTLKTTKTDISNIKTYSTLCYKGFHFDPMLRKCIACPNNYFYSFETNTCDRCPLDMTYHPMIQICAQPGTVEPPDFHCPITTPYYNKYTKKCLKCPVNQQYISKTHSCKPYNYISACPPSKPLYNISTLICEQCPLGMPNYDPYYHVCDPCTQQNPIYDPKSHRCLACPDELVYNRGKGRCTVLFI